MAIRIEIPGQLPVELRHLVCDFNGTLATDGQLLPQVADRLKRLSQRIRILVATSDTFGTAQEQLQDIPVQLHRLSGASSALQKAALIEALGRTSCVMLGNGRNDVAALHLARLSIVVLGTEGVAVQALNAAHLCVSSPIDALDLLLYPARLTATLRA
ncbi:MAG: ATPase P [Firmicutes bacterium]|nr:ATPase P [Bacillota bacterium]